MTDHEPVPEESALEMTKVNRFGVWIRTGPLRLSAVESEELAMHGVTGQRLWKSRQAARQWAVRNLSGQWVVTDETHFQSHAGRGNQSGV